MRNSYDLSHYSARIGALGHLMTVSRTDVLPNDTHALSVTGALRLAPLRQPVSMDCRVDMFTFFVPHRHCYKGENAEVDWVTFIKEGYADDSMYLPSIEHSVDGFYPYLGDVFVNSDRQMLAHIIRGYNKIYQNYFVIPHDPLNSAGGVDYLPAPSAQYANYGLPSARLPSLHSTPLVNDTDYGEFANSGPINLEELASFKAEYQKFIDLQVKTDRYRDVIKQAYGSKLMDSEEDERPTLLCRSSTWMSGYDVDGTSGDSLGLYSGKSQSMVNHVMPPKYFKEHGTLWTMALLRFPPIFDNETAMNDYHSASKPANYKSRAGDPKFAMSLPVDEYRARDLFAMPAGGDNTVGYYPHDQAFRTHHNFVHERFSLVAGYPFIHLDQGGIDSRSVQYEFGDNYSDVFQTDQEGQWRLIAKVSQSAKRVTPPAEYSLDSAVRRS